jgi:hypothetical protein
MKKQKCKMDTFTKVCFGMAGAILILITILLMTSCKSVEYVTVEKVKTDTTYITKQQRDSIWLHDSIHIKERGDTMLIERWHTKYIEKVTHDTTYVATHDTIPQPYPVTQYVEKKLSWMQKALITIGFLTLMGLVIAIALWIKKHSII